MSPITLLLTSDEEVGSGTSRAMTTKGDANPAADPWVVGLDGLDLTKHRLTIPYVGRLVAGGARPLALLMLGGVGLTAAWSVYGRRPERGACGCDARPAGRHRARTA